ncbi:MAG: hypothetical protein Q8K78_01545 [Planctomycetaceae bacterium]|nr:hypothetical protein [Planctomycetaceae bacterium]
MLPAGPTSAETWAKLVRQDIDNATLRQLVVELEDAKRHDDVIALLEQSILAGKSQPWMYEVLALAMEIAGRPRAQIERVLLSTRDLIPADTTSLLFLAAYLARFERFPQAVRCCRQAAELEPTRLEPYVEALRFAKRGRDTEGMAWAAVGVMVYGWGPKRSEFIDSADTAVAEVQAAWNASGDTAKLVEFNKAVTEAKRCDLHIRLEWTGAGELDLVMDEPSGSTCSRENPFTTAGGVLVHDGLGPKPENCYDEYVCPQAWPGEYKARVRHGWGQIVGKRARLIVTRHEGTPQEEREIINVNIGAEDVLVRISLRNGRRQKVAMILPALHLDQKPGRVQQTVAQRLAPVTQGQLGPGGGNGGGGGFPQGGGAVGYQPVIQFINEGVTMSALATVSGDRRYVRITTQPVFSSITDVFTFSFVR